VNKNKEKTLSPKWFDLTTYAKGHEPPGSSGHWFTAIPLTTECDDGEEAVPDGKRGQ
jgi:hypothetical protein